MSQTRNWMVAGVAGAIGALAAGGGWWPFGSASSADVEWVESQQGPQFKLNGLYYLRLAEPIGNGMAEEWDTQILQVLVLYRDHDWLLVHNLTPLMVSQERLMHKEAEWTADYWFGPSAPAAKREFPIGKVEPGFQCGQYNLMVGRRPNGRPATSLVARWWPAIPELDCETGQRQTTREAKEAFFKGPTLRSSLGGSRYLVEEQRKAFSGDYSKGELNSAGTFMPSRHLREAHVKVSRLKDTFNKQVSAHAQETLWLNLDHVISVWEPDARQAVSDLEGERIAQKVVESSKALADQLARQHDEEMRALAEMRPREPSEPPTPKLLHVSVGGRVIMAKNSDMRQGTELMSQSTVRTGPSEAVAISLGPSHDTAFVLGPSSTFRWDVNTRGRERGTCRCEGGVMSGQCGLGDLMLEGSTTPGWCVRPNR